MATAIAGTVREALASATDALEAAGVDTARLDAELLLGEATGRDRAALVAEPAAGIAAPAARRFGGMIRRRVRREPVAYILGHKGFRDIELAVDSRVLIPRPETELLVEVALELSPNSVLEIGTGSGAVALAVADELAGVSVRGTDTSADAIAVARANALSLGLTDRVKFDAVATSFRYAERKSQSERQYDLVLANLPYVRDDEWATLPPEIREFEPREALLGGPDGLRPIRHLLTCAPVCAAIALEAGAGQAPEVEALVTAAGFTSAERRRDLAGIERVIVGRR